MASRGSRPKEPTAPLRDGVPVPADWQTRYLDHVRLHGHYALAAHVAGISQKTAQRERSRNPDFDEQCREAREEAADRIELQMMESANRSDNPVGFIVRLKALRPHEYIEKHAVVSLNVSADLPGVDAAQLLRAMIANFSEPTRQLLAALPDPDAAPHDTTAAERELQEYRAGRLAGPPAFDPPTPSSPPGQQGGSPAEPGPGTRGPNDPDPE